jgi:antitoxin VapB
MLRDHSSISRIAVAGRLPYIDGRKVQTVGLNIKNDETYRLVEELAKLTGETLTGAVTQAVRERLDRLRRERGDRLADRLLLIGKDCAARLKEPFRSADHGDLLYDDRGLPR